MVPAFSTFNMVGGGFVFGLIIISVYFTNTWNTGTLYLRGVHLTRLLTCHLGYIWMVDNHVWDHYGNRYNVSRALDERGFYDHEKYMDYSAAYLGAANSVLYGAFFAMYSAAMTYIILFHRYEVVMGFKTLLGIFKRKKTARRAKKAGTAAAEPEAEADTAVDGEYQVSRIAILFIPLVFLPSGHPMCGDID